MHHRGETRPTCHVVSQRWSFYAASVLFSFQHGMASTLVPPANAAAQYSLTTSTSLPFPTTSQSSTDAQAFMTSQWSLYDGRVSWGGSNIAFVGDPFPTNPAPVSVTNATDPVLQITYPAGSYSGGTGGAQWYTQWKSSDGSTFNSMLLSYELAFDSDFDWVKGGKLPGLRGGSDAFGCSGGTQPTGGDCFSTRLMWRSSAVGEGRAPLTRMLMTTEVVLEVYAYMLTPNGLCSKNGIECNSDYGISIDRGAFGFASRQ